MPRVHKLTLELLRHGPANNQLLSPLTQYLALAGDRSAVTLNQPYEHQRFLRDVSALRYEGTPANRGGWLDQMAREIGDMLAKATSFKDELSVATTQPVDLINLELVVSAQELALLPFELSQNPGGVAGGPPLQLLPKPQLTITRRVRSASTERFRWPKEPRILFAAASPTGVGVVPVEDHLLALRQAIDPWVKYYDPQDPDTAGRQARIDDHLVFLPNASLFDIQNNCKTGRFSYVHILAHGVPYAEVGGERFGIALHDSGNRDAMDVVDGVRLAAAIGSYAGTDDPTLSSPVAVSIASCDAGNVGSVIGAGASVAHQLHMGGIPLVVTSQFPLSFGGSTLLTKLLYEHLLRVDDPRIALSDIRRSLSVRFKGTHDWASIVAYGAFPDEWKGQLDEACRRQAYRGVNAALDHADHAIRSLESARANGATNGLLEQVTKRIERARERYGLQPQDPETLGLLASSYKREAQALHLVSQVHPVKSAARASYAKQSLDALRCSLQLYQQAVKKKPWSHWHIIQCISLSQVLGVKLPELTDLWATCRLSCEADMESENPRARAWAHGSLAELYMLLAALPQSGLPPKKDARRKTLEYVRKLLKVESADSFAIYSTRRQFDRYVDWLPMVSKNAEFKKIAPIAKAVVDELPDDSTNDSI